MSNKILLSLLSTAAGNMELSHIAFRELFKIALPYLLAEVEKPVGELTECLTDHIGVPCRVCGKGS